VTVAGMLATTGAWAKGAQHKKPQDAQSQAECMQRRAQCYKTQAEAATRQLRQTQAQLAQQQAQMQAQQQQLSQLQQQGPDITREVQSSLFFEVDESSPVLPEGTDVIASAAQAAQLDPNVTISVTGHTDLTGPSDYNQTLSEQRAEDVKDLLVAQGVPEDRIEVQGLGEEGAQGSGSSPSERVLHRRVDIAVTPSDTGIGGSGIEPGTIPEDEPMQDPPMQPEE
jgi:outer membrane protein OmpA-like peptidoglycan-associated protein